MFRVRVRGTPGDKFKVTFVFFLVFGKHTIDSETSVLRVCGGNVSGIHPSAGCCHNMLTACVLTGFHIFSLLAVLLASGHFWDLISGLLGYLGEYFGGFGGPGSRLEFQ